MKITSRRRFLTLATLAALPPASFGYGSLVERHRVRLRRATVPLSPEAAAFDGLKVSLLSDFHFDEGLTATTLERAVAMSNAERPDLVVLCGDYVSLDPRAAPEVAALLGGLQARLGCFAVLGNHDHWASPHLVRQALEKVGIDVLRNRHQRLVDRGSTLAVAGLDSAFEGLAAPDEALRGIPRDCPYLLALHEPDAIDTLPADSRRAVQLSGHTHGGQVCAPMIGPLILPQLGRKYVAGLYETRQGPVYVSRGVGTTGLSVRFCCPPEINLLTLRA